MIKHKCPWLSSTAITSRLLALAMSLICLATAGAAENGDVVPLFDGASLDQWRRRSEGAPVMWFVAADVGLDERDPHRFAVAQGTGVMVSGAGKSHNLFCKRDHGDGKFHIEFVVAKASNSGVYFQGRYEIQILDSYGKRPESGGCGGIYERWENDRGFEGRAPRVNASKKPGEWQSFDVIFRAPRFDEAGRKIENARFVEVHHNGVVVHQSAEVTGPTRGAAFSDEQPTGPLMFQGDHGLIAYRNITFCPLKID